MAIQSALCIALLVLTGCSSEITSKVRGDGEASRRGDYPVSTADIIAQDFRSTEELILWLPDRFKVNFQLMIESQSRHQASAEFPRVIMFDLGGRNAKRNGMIVAYSTDPEDPHLNEVETIELDYESGTYEFRNFVFEGDAVSVSDANPRMCQACHSSNLRPNWEPYNHWPGALGPGEEYTPAERQQLLALTSNNQSARLAILDGVQHLAQFEGQVLGTPAFFLHSRLSSFQTKRMARKVIDLNRTGQFADYTLAAAVLDCADFPEKYVDGPVDEQRYARLKASADRMGDALDPLIKPLYEFNMNRSQISDAHVAANLEYLQRDGFAMEDFGKSFVAPAFIDVTNINLSSFAGKVFRGLYGDRYADDLNIHQKSARERLCRILAPSARSF